MIFSTSMVCNYWFSEAFYIQAKAVKKLWPYHPLGNNRGILLAVVLMVMAIFLSITAAGLVVSQLNLKATTNFKTGTAALQAADAGIPHALALIPSGTNFNSLLTGGVAAFPCVPSSPCDGTTKKATLTGTLSSYTYTVVVDNDTTVPGETALGDKNKIITLTSTAPGPNSSNRKVRAYIGRSSRWTPPAAVYFTGTPAGHKLFDPSGKQFFITGNDTNYNDTTPSPAASPLPGIAATNSGVATEIIDTLTSDEKKLIKGVGYNSNPLTPSVQSTSTVIDIDNLAQNFYNNASAVNIYENGINYNPTTCPSAHPCTLGTDAAPQITYIKAGTGHIHLDGYVTGSGVLVLEGKAHLFGDFNFHGLVILKEPPVPPGQNEGDDETLRFKMKDHAKIYGALLEGPNGTDFRFDIKNQAKIQYSSAAIDMVNNVFGFLLPTPPKIIAWQEMMQ